MCTVRSTLDYETYSELEHQLKQKLSDLGIEIDGKVEQEIS